MTYNIYNGAKDTLDSVIEIINTTDPDVLVFNEANQFNDNHNRKFNKVLGETQLEYAHLEPCGDGDPYHVAILSKTKFANVYAIHPMSRATILASVTGHERLTIIGTHLSPYNEDERLKEVELIGAALDDTGEAVILGDLNSISHYSTSIDDIVQTFNKGQIRKFTTDGVLRLDVMKKFEQMGFVDTAVWHKKQNDITVPTSINNDGDHANGLRLDYALVSKSLVKHLTHYEVIKSDICERASDHYPVVIEIDV